MLFAFPPAGGVLGIVDRAGSQGVFSLYDPKMTSLKVGNRPAYQLLGRQPAETRYLYYMRNFRMWVIRYVVRACVRAPYNNGL